VRQAQRIIHPIGRVSSSNHFGHRLFGRLNTQPLLRRQENNVLAAMFNVFVRLLHFDEDGWVDEFDTHDPLAS
jgi:hypothetical protein